MRLNPTNSFPSGPTDTTVHYMYSDSLVSSSCWVDPSNPREVCVKGTNLQAGQPYLFREWLSRLTGDSTQNRTYTLNVKGSAAIQISQVGITHDSTYPNRSIFAGYTLHSGDTGVWIAPAIADSFEFSHWSCPGVSGIDGSANDTLRLTLLGTAGLTAIKSGAQSAQSQLFQKIIAGGLAGLSALTFGTTLLPLAADAILSLANSSWLTNSDDIIAQSGWMGKKEDWWGAKLPLTQSNSYGDESGMGTTTTTIQVTLQ